MHLYQETGTYKCFGCGAYGRFKDIGLPQLDLEPTGAADLGKELAYIDSLPIKEIRGLDLPYDADNFYIVWPDRTYFLRRAIGTTPGGAKYTGPAGHPRPLLEYPNSSHHVLAIVEGEVNALSVHKAVPEIAVMSPGSAGNFYAKSKLKHLPLYAKYDKILIIADADKAGAIAAIELKSLLIQLGKHPRITLWEKDPNDVLVQHGKETLQAKVCQELKELD